MQTVKITRTYDVEVPRTVEGRPGYAWVAGYTYKTKNGGQACGDTLANTRHTCEQEWPGAKIEVVHHA